MGRLIDAIGLKQALAVSAILEDKKTIEQIIDEQPTIEPERKTGRWILVASGRGGYECSYCHEYAPSYRCGEDRLSNFCPNCGAKMDGGEQDGR